MKLGIETISYSSDSSHGSVVSLSSNQGWGRHNIAYNKFGSVLQEIQDIQGLGSKTLAYNYDGYNLLNSTTYPDGKMLLGTNNGLKMPEGASFSGKSIINADDIRARQEA